MYYGGLLVYQTIIVICCIVFVAVAAGQRMNKVSKLMLVIAFLCLIQNASYLMEMQATSYDGALLTTKIRYVGVAFMSTFFLIFCARYRGKTISPKLQGVMFAWDSFVLLAVWTCDRHPFFYRRTEYLADATFPYLYREFGIIFYINFAYYTLQLLACAGLAIDGWKHGNNDKYRNSCKILVLSSLLPLLSVVTHISGIWVGFEPLPSLCAISVMIFFLSAIFKDMFDISQVAHQNIFANMREPIIVVDGNYGFVEANMHAEEVFPSLRDCKIGDLLPEPRLITYLRTGISNKLYYNQWVFDVHVDRIYEDEVLVGYSLLLTDMTDEDKQMQRIQALMKAANDANQAKTDFLANMSHELRTPINSIIGMNEMILREEPDTQIQRYSQNVKSAASMLLSLVNDILDSSKIAAGKLRILPVAYDLGTLVCDLYQMMIAQARAKNITLTFELDPLLPRRYIGDDIRIRQVLINLLSNGIKYTQEGSVVFRITGQIEGEEAKLHFSIKDTGEGISRDNIAKLFSRFDRLEEAGKRHIEGTGLGLNVSSSLLHLMGSKVEIQSEVGVGSEFSFTLEQPVNDHTPVGSFAKLLDGNTAFKEYNASFVAPKAQILVVDDNEMNRKVFVGLLKESRMQITEAESGRECLELTAAQHFDLIFLDHMMPEMDGIETLKNMQQDKTNRCHDVPVIMLTANAIAGARERYLAEGFTDFLSKPIFSDQLEQMIARYLPRELMEQSAVSDTVTDEPSEGTHPADAPDGKTGADSALPQIEDMDFEYAMMVFRNEDALRLALQDFVQMLPRTQAQMELLFEGIAVPETREEYARILHTLKGNAATVGALLLSKLARMVEIELRGQNPECVRQLHPILMEQIRRHVTLLSDFAPKRCEGSYEDICNVLQMMQDAIEQEDMTSADFLLHELDMFVGIEEVQEQMSQLRQAVESLDRQQALYLTEALQVQLQELQDNLQFSIASGGDKG